MQEFLAAQKAKDSEYPAGTRVWDKEQYLNDGYIKLISGKWRPDNNAVFYDNPKNHFTLDEGLIGTRYIIRTK